MKKWKVYIVGHSEIHEETVNCDRGFNNENYNYLNVGCGDTLINSEKYVVINQRELDNCELIGKYWAESEGIYNIWRSRSFEDLDYIGFIHYDVKLEIDKNIILEKLILLKGSTSISRIGKEDILVLLRIPPGMILP